MTAVAPGPAETGTVDPTRVHFPPFDGLRAIAAIAVALTHAAFISGFNVRSDFWGPITARLDVGVAVFFVISGVLLYRPYAAARFHDRPPPALRAYLTRRFLRIYPAFWVAFTLIVFVLPHTDGEVPDLGGLVAHYTLTHIYFADHVLGPVQQSWTLATELSFYLVLPAYATLLRRVRGTPGRRLGAELTGLAALYALSVGFRAWVHVAGLEPAGMYKTWLPARTDMFALGMLLAVASAWWSRPGARAPRWTEARPLPWVSWALALACLHVAAKELGLEAREARTAIAFTGGQELALHFLYGAIAFLLVVPAVLGPPRAGTVRRFLNLSVLQWLGLVSYGIYLWHEAAIDAWLVWLDRAPFQGGSAVGFTPPLGLDAAFVELVVLMALTSVAFAALSWYLVERPALRLGPPRPRVRERER